MITRKDVRKYIINAGLMAFADMIETKCKIIEQYLEENNLKLVKEQIHEIDFIMKEIQEYCKPFSYKDKIKEILK
jgi:hypothetical protein